MKSRLELHDQSCLGCLAGVSSECKYAGWLLKVLDNCANLKSNAILDREQMQWHWMREMRTPGI